MAAEVSPPRRLALPACGACRLFAAPTQAACTLSDGAGLPEFPNAGVRAQTDMLMSMRRESNCNTCHDMRTTRSRV